MVDWIAVYDATTNCCIYIPSSEFDGYGRLHVRYRPCSYNRVADVRLAEDYLDL